MHITLEADYAVRMVNCLAENNCRMDAKSISVATGVTLRFALKILRKLVGQGIIRSYKGMQGGYELNRPPSLISLGEVIETVDGPISFCRCVGVEDYQCSRGSTAECKFTATYAEVSRMVRDKLYSVHFG